ncbi:solute carrier family 12 member 8-like isoform X2 [Carassius carassius]|uniref:solute carrier family 12 member 8-like isoform X2 n=1 Tax=Carassius carassius TaxID=217509 RepID=UPI0028684EDA|nr:solute carrier family 12 member 8-like isoform X2 [Carassius carassius]
MSPQVQDLFHEDAQGSQSNAQPWWKVQLFVWEPVLFGTWDGVFTTCMINIFGVVLFLRTGWLVGNTGVLLGMLLVSIVVLVALVTVMSGVGVCECCSVGNGGVYSMISTVLGGRIGGTLGLLYVFGQCVAGAMYITGFAESIAQMLNLQSMWAVRGISVAVLIGLLGINLAGVKWIVRLQLVLLGILAVSTLDFVIGTFSHLDPGVMAGFNMSSDLQRPEHNIPVGTLAAVFTSWFLYLVFVFLLGAICTREALRYDFLIAEKVSLVGFLFLLGLYISSLASCMGGLYGAPRILQCIAQERVIPALGFLGKGRGPNKTPVAAICLTSLVSMAFIFVGQVNVLAPIVTINFMLTYSIIDYCYFCVVKTHELEVQQRTTLIRRSSSSRSLVCSTQPHYGSSGAISEPVNGTLLEFTKDMDQIFPLPNMDTADEQRVSIPASKTWGRKSKIPAKETLMNSFGWDLNSNGPLNKGKDEKEPEQTVGLDDDTSSHLGHMESVLTTEPKRKQSLPNSGPVELEQLPREQIDRNGSETNLEGSEIRSIQGSVYGRFCNHWVSFVGALCSFMIMFVIQWMYALINITVALILFLYIGTTSPGLPTGAAARFSFFRCLKTSLHNLERRDEALQDQIVVTTSLSAVSMETRQLTEENADFALRDRYHHSSFINTTDKIVHSQSN